MQSLMLRRTLDSVVNVAQVATLDQLFLMERTERLPEPKLQTVEEGLRLVVRL